MVIAMHGCTCALDHVQNGASEAFVMKFVVEKHWDFLLHIFVKLGVVDDLFDDCQWKVSTLIVGLGLACVGRALLGFDD